MNTNLVPQFAKDSIVIKKMLQDIGFVTVDEDHYGGGYYEYSKDDKIAVVVSPKLLYYSENYREKNVNEDTLSLWVGVKMWVQPEEDVYEKGKQLRDILKDMPIKSFYDEDACLGMFTKKECASNIKGYDLTCYFNPDYPKGMWENHALN